MLSFVFNKETDLCYGPLMTLMEMIQHTDKSATHFSRTVIDLHERGYCQDFVLFGNNLLWVQEKIFISSNDFSIIECHQFGHPVGQHEDLVILGVMATGDNVKGILMNHYKYTSKMPEVIISKLHMMKSYQSKKIRA
jgi:hypothetical protein